MVQLRPEFVEASDRAEDTESVIQARPNVLIEMGAALAGGRHRVVLVEVGEHRRISDISGMQICRLRSDADARQDLIDRLRDAGAEPDVTARDHLKAGDFDAAVVPYRTASSAKNAAPQETDPCPAGSDEERILALLYTAGQKPISRLHLGQKLGLKSGALDVALDELTEAKLVDPQYAMIASGEEPNPNYYITPKGRRLARDRNL